MDDRELEEQIERLQKTIETMEKNLSADKSELQSLENNTKRICDDLERIEKEMGKSADPAFVRRLNEIKMKNQINYDRIDKIKERILRQEEMLSHFKELLSILKK